CSPNSRLQRSPKPQAQKQNGAPFAPASVFGVWCFENWNFSGAWGLVLGVSTGGGSKTKMRPNHHQPKINITGSWVLPLFNAGVGVVVVNALVVFRFRPVPGHVRMSVELEGHIPHEILDENRIL